MYHCCGIGHYGSSRFWAASKRQNNTLDFVAKSHASGQCFCGSWEVEADLYLYICKYTSEGHIAANKTTPPRQVNACRSASKMSSSLTNQPHPRLIETLFRGPQQCIWSAMAVTLCSVCSMGSYILLHSIRIRRCRELADIVG